jgi:hypothetical protein
VFLGFDFFPVWTSRYPEEGGSEFISHTGEYLHGYTVSQPTKSKSKLPFSWKPRIPYRCWLFSHLLFLNEMKQIYQFTMSVCACVFTRAFIWLRVFIFVCVSQSFRFRKTYRFSRNLELRLCYLSHSNVESNTIPITIWRMGEFVRRERQ